MADLVVTPGQVMPDVTGRITSEIAGATITAGQTIYGTAPAAILLSQCDGTLAEADTKGIALNGGATGQPIAVQRTGSPTLGAGAAPTEGEVYCTSDTPGGIAPDADIATGTWYRTVLGVGNGANGIDITEINASGEQIP